MVEAKRARPAETPIQPSFCLRLRAPHFYPTNQAANREDKLHPNVWEVPSLLESILVFPFGASEGNSLATAELLECCFEELFNRFPASRIDLQEARLATRCFNCFSPLFAPLA